MHTRIQVGAFSVLVLICAALIPASAMAVAAAPMSTSTPAAVKPRAGIDGGRQSTLFTYPTISGTADAVSPLLTVLVESVDTPRRVAVYKNNAVPVVKGRWSTAVWPPISNGLYQVSVSIGDTVLATSTLQIGLRAFPSLAIDNLLPVSDVADGHLMHFKLSAQGAQPISFKQLSFAMQTIAASVTDVSVSGFSDSAYSIAISSSTAPVNAIPIDPSSGTFSVIFDPPLQVPVGTTYYFDVSGSVVPSDTVYSVDTTLLSDTVQTPFMSAESVASSSNVVWSPNTFGIAHSADTDWLNGQYVYGLPAKGLEVVRENALEMNEPTCSLTATVQSDVPGMPVTLSWTSTDTTYTMWADGTRDASEGTKTFTNPQLSRVYTLKFYGPYGTATCYATVANAIPVITLATTTIKSATSSVSTTVSATSSVATTTTSVATTTTQVATSTILDSFIAKPLSGKPPLAVTYTVTTNASSSCSALTYSFLFGESTSTTLSVPSKLCKPKVFTFTHTYKTIGKYTAALYKGTVSGATSTQKPIQAQIITVSTSTMALSPNDSNTSAWRNLAGALTALLSILQKIRGY